MIYGFGMAKKLKEMKLLITTNIRFSPPFNFEVLVGSNTFPVPFIRNYSELIGN